MLKISTSSHLSRNLGPDTSLDNINFHPSILREYDIRGIVGQTLFERDAYWIGRCFGHLVKEKSGSAIAVGRDGRLSSPQLEEALINGLCTAGLNVYQLGLGPTPMLYFAEHELPVDAAIMVTGSHNPPPHNGFKISLQQKPFFGNDIQNFSQLKSETFTKGQGKVYETDLRLRYVNRLLQDLEIDKNLSVAWDPGHGAACEILKDLIERLPGHHILINSDIDGNFPAHPPDPSNPENLRQLQQTVLENKCDLGIALDGDGDRFVAVDNQGDIIWGDQLLLLFASDLLKRKPKATIIADIKTSQGFFDEVSRLGGQAIMWKTGHSPIKAKMAQSGAMFSGEMSGHFYFQESYYGFDDGIYAALQLLQFLSKSSHSLAEFYENLPKFYSTHEIRIPCIATRKFIIPQEIKSRLIAQGYSFVDIDGIRVQLPHGWWLVRASNTQDVLVARCESSTKEGLECIKEHMRGELKKSGVNFCSTL